MPVSLDRVVGLRRPTAGCRVRPDSADWLASLGLTTARDFLALPGVVVSGHVGRNVSRVRLGDATAYLKREHRVRWRDRLRSWCDGFGWVSVSTREAAVLRRLDGRGLPGPRWLAHGEADGQGFLLLEEAAENVELRSLPVTEDEFAERLGEIVADIHAAGIDQPDLFAKHVLIGRAGGVSPLIHAPGADRTRHQGADTPRSPDTEERSVDRYVIAILDWQRASLRRQVTFRQRVRTLASLRATTPPLAMPDPTWRRLVSAYLRAADGREAPAPIFDRFRTAVDRTAAALLRRKTIRSQRRPAGPSVCQELVRIGGETICAIPGVAPLFDDPSAIARVYDPSNNGQPVSLPGTGTGLLRVSRHALPFVRWWAALRGKAWRSPELKLARLLFHLERHGIPAPKLLAYGQTVPRLAAAGSFVLFEPIAAEPLRREHQPGALELLDRLHAADCRLSHFVAAGLQACRGFISGRPGGLPSRLFGVAAGRIVISDPSHLFQSRRLTRSQMDRDRARVRDCFRGLR